MQAARAQSARHGARLFLVGFSTLTLIYAAQPLLPDLATAFGLTSGETAWAISATTTGVALANLAAPFLIPTGHVRRFIASCLALAAAFSLMAALAPSWPVMIAARTLAGLAAGGVPAAALAYAAEDAAPGEAAMAVGSYVAGTALGGMSGRVAVGLLAHILGWRAGLGLAALAAIASTILFLCLTPRPDAQTRAEPVPPIGAAEFAALLGDMRLLPLFATATALTSVSALLFNFIPFRLGAAPYELSRAAASLIYLVFGLGMIASSVAGRAVVRWRPRGVVLSAIGLLSVGVVTTLAQPLACIVVGLALVNIGFFAAHAVVSGWIGELAPGRRPQASALYMLFYYLGFSLGGALGGLTWDNGGWPGLVLVASLLGAFALVAVVGVGARPDPGVGD